MAVELELGCLTLGVVAALPDCLADLVLMAPRHVGVVVAAAVVPASERLFHCVASVGVHLVCVLTEMKLRD